MKETKPHYFVIIFIITIVTSLLREHFVNSVLCKEYMYDVVFLKTLNYHIFHSFFV